MTGTRRKITSVLLAAGIAAVVAACGQSSQAATCDRVDSVRASVEDLRNVDISENGMVAVGSGLAQLQTDLDNLRADVKADQQPQVDAVRSAVTQLQSSVAGIRANPSTTALSQVGTSLEQLRTSIGTLRATVGSGC
jgi:uncharacterized protein HemX